tara:strand:+ start:1442 stop:2239 length:798 start_codon:yes stop_codon:yes gene_type:complete
MLAQKLGLSLPTIKKVGSGAAAFENLYSIDFDANETLDWGDADVFTPNSSGANRGMSWSFWMKTGAGRTGIVKKYETGQQEWTFGIGKSGELEVTLISGNNFPTRIFFNCDTTSGSFIRLDDNAWHHIVITFDLTSVTTSVQAFIDNVNFANGNGAAQIYVGTWSAISNTTSPMVMGSAVFDAFVDEYAIFDTVLSSSEVNEVYNGGTPQDLSAIVGLSSFLIGWWRNGDPTGTGAYPTIVDQSSNSNDGTMTSMSPSGIVTDVP